MVYVFLVLVVPLAVPPLSTNNRSRLGWQRVPDVGKALFPGDDFSIGKRELYHQSVRLCTGRIGQGSLGIGECMFLQSSRHSAYNCLKVVIMEEPLVNRFPLYFNNDLAPGDTPGICTPFWFGGWRKVNGNRPRRSHLVTGAGEGKCCAAEPAIEIR